MKRVGVITILDEINYGNRLQNLAMQALLSGLGWEPVTLRFCPEKRVPVKRRLAQVKLLRWVNGTCRAALGKDEHAETLKKRRKEAVLAFNRRYLSMTPHLIPACRASQKPFGDCRWFVAGSDQIWNPYFIGDIIPEPRLAYLRFAPAEKRIAIAPSFGVAQLPPEGTDTIARYLREFHFLSVREEDGRALIQRLTGLDCPVFPDPTLLVEPEFWAELTEQEPPVASRNYVLAYFLGQVSPERRQLIRDYARRAGLPVVWMNDLTVPQNYVWGPVRFLRAIRDCQALFTDSFHGCVFSLVFQRQFFALSREDGTADMSGRITTLLSMAGLEDRAVAQGAELPPPIPEDGFDRAHERLSRRREEALARLRDVLEGRA